ncbi:MAG: type II toxin-antitoxin system prevent-host-death family antitoxin [Parachlamydiaceae bacterium]
METISADELNGQITDVISRATKDLKQFRITSSEGAVVLLPEEMYDRLVVTLELLSTPGLLEMMESKNPNSPMLMVPAVMS